MRLLFVCDEYPPFDRGGLAQLCYDLAHELRQRGHYVTVLCADTGRKTKASEPVIRALRIPVRWDDRWPVPVQQAFLAPARRQHSLCSFRQAVRQTEAEVVMVWPTPYVEPPLMLEAERTRGVLVAYYIAGFSPRQPPILFQYWSQAGTSPCRRLTKRFLRPLLAGGRHDEIELALRHVMCVSEYERQRVISEGIAPESVVVIHNGVDLSQFPFRGLPSARRQFDAPLRTLYAGRLVQDKGAHTVVQALKILRESHRNVQIRLTLLGSGPAPYICNLSQLIRDYGLDDYVERREWIQRDRMPAIMADFDVLVLPTIHPEPLARVVQEAMALGLVVVATSTGGTPEIVQDGMTGLSFAPGNPRDLANCLLRLYADIPLCDQLAMRAHELVKSQFTIQAMAESVERQLKSWMEQGTRPGHLEIGDGS